jgi:protein SCO1
VNTRVRLVLIAVVAMSLAGMAGAFLAAGERRLEPIPAGFQGALRPPGAPVPEFALRNQDGETVTRPPGSPVIYAFIYSHCEDTCPFEVQQIRASLDALGRDVPVLGVSVDPANDTPQSARAFLAEQHMTGRMEFLLGDREELEPLWEAFGVDPQRDGREHSAGIVLASGDRQRVGYRPDYMAVDDLASDLRRLSG